MWGRRRQKGPVNWDDKELPFAHTNNTKDAEVKRKHFFLHCSLAPPLPNKLTTTFSQFPSPSSSSNNWPLYPMHVCILYTAIATMYYCVSAMLG